MGQELDMIKLNISKNLFVVIVLWTGLLEIS